MKKLFPVLVLILLSLACSSNKTAPTVPDNTTSDSKPVIVVEPEDSSHNFLGSFTATVNIESLSASIQPNRTPTAHHNITDLIPTPLITINSWDPITEIIDIDIQLHNSTWTSVYDVRLIIFTDPAGHLLINDDNWTPLWDIPDGQIANPFKAYAKNRPNRIFTGETFHQENFQIKCPNNNFNVQFAIDASFPGNCEEPYEIIDFNQSRLFDSLGASCNVEITAKDWQDDIDTVSINCTGVLGTIPLMLSNTGGTEWEGYLTNSQGAAIGVYPGYVKATSQNTPYPVLYDEITITVSSGDVGWAKTWGPSYTWPIEASVVDNWGNIYITGRFDRLTDFDPGPGVDQRDPTGSGDIYLCKFDKNGTYQWTCTWGGNDGNLIFQESGYGLALDQNGNILVTGGFFGTVDFDPGPEIDEHISNGILDAFLVKLDPDSNFIWAKSWGSTNDDHSGEVAMDAAGNLVLTGIFDGITDFDPGPGTYIIDSAGIFLLKLNSDGDFIWAYDWGIDNFRNGVGVEIDNSSNIYAYGHLQAFGEVDFDPGSGQAIYEISGVTIYLSKFDSNGMFAWVYVGSSSGLMYGTDMAIDNSGNCWLTGSFVTSWPHFYNTNMFLKKITPEGILEWSHGWSYSQGENSGYGVTCDNSGNVYLTGKFSNNIDLDPGSGQDSHTSEPYTTSVLFISKYTSSAQFVWAQTWGDTFTGAGYDSNIDPDGNIFLTGTFWGTMDFDPGPNEDLHTALGSPDTFLIKLLSNGFWE